MVLPSNLRKRVAVAAGFVGLPPGMYVEACVAGGLQVHADHDEHLRRALAALDEAAAQDPEEDE